MNSTLDNRLENSSPKTFPDNNFPVTTFLHAGNVQNMTNTHRKSRHDVDDAAINQLSHDELIQHVVKHGLSQEGSIPVLRRRAKTIARLTRVMLSSSSHFVRDDDDNNQPIGNNFTGEHPRSMTSLNIKSMLPQAQNYRHFLIMDFEATCDDFSSSISSSSSSSSPSPSSSVAQHPEIIEFPAILFDPRSLQVVASFHSFVRPVLCPKLSQFCTRLTGISQHQVDAAPTFPKVLEQFSAWLRTHTAGAESESLAVVCDCSADLAKFMRIQCLQVSGIALPGWAHSWINLRKVFRAFYSSNTEELRPICNRKSSRYFSSSLSTCLKLSDMLQHLGCSFAGRLHSGMDDARNILRVVEQLLLDGAILDENERLCLNSPHLHYCVSYIPPPPPAITSHSLFPAAQNFVLPAPPLLSLPAFPDFSRLSSLPVSPHQNANHLFTSFYHQQQQQLEQPINVCTNQTSSSEDVTAAFPSNHPMLYAQPQQHNLPAMHFHALSGNQQRDSPSRTRASRFRAAQNASHSLPHEYVPPPSGSEEFNLEFPSLSTKKIGIN